MQQDLTSGNLGLSSSVGEEAEDSPWRWVTTFTLYVGRLAPNLFSDHMETLKRFYTKGNIYLVKIPLEILFHFIFEGSKSIKCLRLKVAYGMNFYWDLLENAKWIHSVHIWMAGGCIVFNCTQSSGGGGVPTYLVHWENLQIGQDKLRTSPVRLKCWDLVRYFKTSYYLSTDSSISLYYHYTILSPLSLYYIPTISLLTLYLPGNFKKFRVWRVKFLRLLRINFYGEYRTEEPENVKYMYKVFQNLQYSKVIRLRSDIQNKVEFPLNIMIYYKAGVRV